MPQKKVDKVDKQVESYGGVSQTQFEILNSLANFLTITDIAKYRKCSRQAVYKVVRRLIDHGLVEKIGNVYGLTQKGKEGLHSFIGFTNKIRQHNLGIKIQVLDSPRNWEKKRNKIITMSSFNKRIQLKNNSYEILNLGQVKIKTTTKSVIIWLPAMYDDTVEGALSQAMDMLFNVIPKIETQLKVKLIKDRKMNMTIISQEYARLNDAMAKIYKTEGNKIYFTNEEGEVWLISDFSFSTDELETVHPKSAGEDMTTVHKFMNDLRKNPATISELGGMIQNVTANQMVFDHNMKSHLEVLNKLGNAVEKLTKKIDELGEKK